MTRWTGLALPHKVSSDVAHITSIAKSMVPVQPVLKQWSKSNVNGVAWFEDETSGALFLPPGRHHANVAGVSVSSAILDSSLVLSRPVSAAAPLHRAFCSCSVYSSTLLSSALVLLASAPRFSSRFIQPVIRITAWLVASHSASAGKEWRTSVPAH